MKKKYSILKTLAVGALILSTSVFGNAKTKRMVLIEEGTNASCPPCAAQNPSFKEWLVSKKSNVIPVIFRANFPGPDNVNALNPGMHNYRIATYYAMNGVPSVRVNGKITTKTGSWYDGAPGDLTALDAALAAEMAKGESPIAIKIQQTKNGGNIDVKVDVSSDEALNNAKLRVVVSEGYIFDANAGTNGEKEFFWVARAMMPNNDGATVSLAASEEKSFTFSVPVNAAWKESEMYVVAFVQNDATKEVLQAASNFVNPTTTMTAPKSAALKAPMAGEDFSMSISNTSEQEITYQWTLAKSGRTPGDWDASVVGSSGEITVGAGATEDLTIRLVPGATAGIGDAILSVTPKDHPDKRVYTHQVTVLSSNVEKLNVMAEAAADVGVGSVLLAETGHENYIDITSLDLENLYKDMLAAKNIKYVVWNGGKAGGLNRTGGIALASLLESGTGVLITGQVSLPLLVFEEPGNALFSILGMNWDPDSGNINSTQNGTFKLLGVSGDIITNGMDMTGKRVSYVMQELLINGANTTPILRLQSPNRDIAAKAQLENARAVVLAFHPDVIQDVNQRKTLIDKAVDWIEGFTAAPKPHAILNFQPDQPIDFGKVKVGEQKEITLELQAANAAGLEISDISEFSDGLFNEYGVSIVGLPSSFPATPITLAEGEKLSFKLRFAPTKIGMIGSDVDAARLSIGTNEDGGIYLIDVTGEAVSVTSVGETVSRNGEFSVSAGPNPFAGSTVVRYELNGSIARNVRVALFNEQGREVSVLVNKTVMPGEHTATVDGSNLATGMYRVVMTVDGESVSLPVVNVK